MEPIKNLSNAMEKSEGVLYAVSKQAQGRSLWDLLLEREMTML